MKQAVIDLGTNTFHLLVVEQGSEGVKTLFKDSTPTYIGRAGINKGVILPEAIERAVVVLKRYRQKINELGVESVKAIGTSAIRNAANRDEFCDEIYQQTGIEITVISGDKEAEYIYKGVRLALNLGVEPSLIIDIGGGSVEFIICNQERIFWKQSFEIGGQRLMERFMKSDPISPSAIARLHDYFQEQLLPLANAVHQYQPQILVGSSGSFDTLVDMDFMHQTNQLPNPSETGFELKMAEFQRTYELLTTLARPERMALEGMIELRVDMIVVAVVLIDHIIKRFDIQRIRCSTFALKEGVLNVL